MEKDPHNKDLPQQTPPPDSDGLQMPEGYTEEHTSHLGAILGVLVIVLVLILGGLYLWGASLTKERAAAPREERVNNEPETTRAQADVEINNTVSSSDELNAIEADLESTDLSSLDNEVNAIEAELNAAQ